MTIHRKLAALLGAGLLTFALFGSTASVLAVGEKVTICHATTSESHPYVEETVDIASSGAFEGLLKAGHSFHVGEGVWYAGAKADKFEWGDIIPAYTYTPAEPDFVFPGLNNDADGLEILGNHCKVEGEVVEAFIVTEVHLGATDTDDPIEVDDVDTAVAGDSVHDSARLEFPGDGEIPGESMVMFFFWNNHTCDGEPNEQSDPILVGGESSPVLIDEALAQGPLGEGEYSYRADFISGNTEIVSNATGDCEPFTVTSSSSTTTTTSSSSTTNFTGNLSGTTTQEDTDTIGGSGSGQQSSATWLLLAALGVLLGSIIVVAPSRAKTRQ